MGQEERTLEQKNEAQRKTIVEMTQMHKEVMERMIAAGLWERFAAHLLHNCIGQTVTRENLEKWMAEMLEAELKAAKESKKGVLKA